MSDDTTEVRDDAADADEQDTEGHNVWINPTLSRDLTTSRSRDVEREARERQRAKESRGR